MVMTHARAKGQRSVDSKECKQTDGLTDGAYCITFLANAVGKNCTLASTSTAVTLVSK